MKIKAVLTACCVVLLVACGDDPFRVRPFNENVSDTIAVFAFTGTPLSAPSALNTARHEAVLLEAGSGFDVAFDINTAGQAVLYPPELVAQFGRAGFRKAMQPFDAIMLAPLEGYVENAALAVMPGEAILIRAASSDCANQQLRPFIYSKLVVDSVRLSDRTVHFRVRVDPNCGFRSFRPGLPEQ